MPREQIHAIFELVASKGSKPWCPPGLTAIRSHCERCAFLSRSRLN